MHTVTSYLSRGLYININFNQLFSDINEDCRKRDLERIFQKYGPLKEIWLASYAPFYAFIVFRARRDAEVRRTLL